METDTPSKHILQHSEKKYNKEARIDFLSGVCFAREGQFNESTSTVPERGEPWTRDKKMFSLFHECQRLRVTRMDLSPGCDLNSRPQSFRWGEVFRDLGPFIMCPKTYKQRYQPQQQQERERDAMFCKTNMFVQEVQFRTKILQKQTQS